MINKIPEDNYIDYEVEETALCPVCKSIGRIPCDHIQRDFRRKDRIDHLIEGVNRIIERLNDTPRTTKE